MTCPTANYDVYKISNYTWGRKQAILQRGSLARLVPSLPVLHARWGIVQTFVGKPPLAPAIVRGLLSFRKPKQDVSRPCQTIRPIPRLSHIRVLIARIRGLER